MTVSRVAVIGDGVVGLASAFVAADRGVHVTLFAPALAGAASPASAGMLAPSIERTSGAGQSFGEDSRDAWPRLLQRVIAAGGDPFELRQNGILQIARTTDDVTRLQARLRDDDHWVTPATLRAREPDVSPDALGAACFPRDGVVDAPAAITSLRRLVASHSRIDVHRNVVERIHAVEPRVSVRGADGVSREFDRVVIATGAWSATLPGLPRLLPIRPLRGALVAVDAQLVREPVYGPGGHTYILPRHGRTVIGATSDDVGFDHSIGPSDSERLLEAAEKLIPGVRQHPLLAPWAGLRPMTPDRLPILGADVRTPALLYACGHGRNGFLHAALTAEVITAIILGEATRDLTPFSVGRFDD